MYIFHTHTLIYIYMIYISHVTLEIFKLLSDTVVKRHLKSKSFLYMHKTFL